MGVLGANDFGTGSNQMGLHYHLAAAPIRPRSLATLTAWGGAERPGLSSQC
jgi:hypothetical protein